MTFSRKNRREFLATTGGAALAAGVWSEVPAQESKSPNEKLKLLCVGTANRAARDISGVEGENLVALCDVDSNYLSRASAKFPVRKNVQRLPRDDRGRIR